MAGHERFHFKNLEELRQRIYELHVAVHLSEDTEILGRPVRIGDKIAPNAFAVLPMEGCDSLRDGSPSELVHRRYRRFAEGGAGLLWWEANAIVEEGRANDRQMMLTNKNVSAFRKLVSDTLTAAKEANGPTHRPINILQLTHSGRYARPVGHKPAPIVPQHDPILDPRVGLEPDAPVCTDEYLDGLVERYVDSALLAKQAGFDGVDIKACHRYLMSEILACHTRPGKYGGSFENRSRLLLNVINQVKEACGKDFIVACRFNVFDAHPYPYGFGVDSENPWKFSPDEPLRLVREMIKAGVELLSNSAGNPYYIYPQVTRPFDSSSMGIPIPEEHPLESIARLFDFTRQIQQAASNIPVVGNGYSWLRQFIPYAGAANLLAGSCRFVGMGRQSFAYPSCVRDFLRDGAMDANKCCITCSKCTQIMRDHGTTGCVVRDAEIYAPLFRKFREEADRRETR